MLRFLSLIVALALLCGLVSPAAVAQPAAVQKKLLDYHAYAAWRAIRDTRVSRDGRWVAYAEVPAEADGELVVRDVTGTTAYRSPRGRTPAFTADGRFVVFRIAAPVAGVKAAEKADTPADKRPKDGMGIMVLAEGSPGDVTALDGVRSFKLAQEGSAVAYLLEPPPAPSASPSTSASPGAAASAVPSAAASPSPRPPAAPSPSPHASAAPAGVASASPAKKGPEKDAPTSLGIRRLRGGVWSQIAHVSEYAISADGSRVAYVVQTKADESIHVRDVAHWDDRIVAHGTAHLTAPALSADGAMLVYLSDPTAYADPAPKKGDGARAPFRLMVADTRGGTAAEAFGEATPGAAAGTFASDAVPPEFSADGKRVAFATTNVPAPRPSSAPARVDLDFWYWRDGELPTQQRHQAEDPRHDTYRALYDVATKRTVQLETPAVPDVTLAKDARYALGISNVPYVKLATYDDAYWDVYRVDVTTGARTLMLRRAKGGPPRLSPAGAYAAGYDPVRRAWYTLRMRDGHRSWITDPHTMRAAVEDDDHPAEPPPYGFGGWTPGDTAALLYDRYDVWVAQPDGRSTYALTSGGRTMHRIYRVVQPRTDEPASVFTPARPAFDQAPFLLNVVDDRTKASGFATVMSLATQKPRVSMLLDASVGPPIRARDTGRYVFTEERFDRFPDLWTTGPVPANAERVSDANPQAARFAWGHSRLIDYTNAHGEKLRAILTTPDGFDSHRHYPMLVYVYEKMTDGLHRYVMPASGTVVNLARYANHGYVVLQPDIRYRIGHTTASAVDCVSSAVKHVVSMGFVDPARIGMAGHSYGGYEVNALVTHTNIFRAVESGASDSDLPSLYGGFWESGDVQQSYYETGQGRIGATPWARPDLYVENSPLFFVQHITAPYLRIQDDKDGFVPYGQGVEFFTALRRAGKEAYMFTFIGENHGLAKQPNKNYWTVHLDEFFDHFLLGTPRPEWMTHNGSYEHRGERDVDALFTPASFGR